MRRVLRWVVTIIATLVLITLVLGVGLVVALHTRREQEWLAHLAATQAQRYVPGRVSIDRVTGSLVSSVTVHGLSLDG